jgi:acyl carrier protein
MESILPQDDPRGGIHRVVEGVFRDLFRDKSLTIHTETSAKDIEGWDSLAHITLIVAIEKKFGIKFKLAELQEIRNVGDILALVKTKTGK